MNNTERMTPLAAAMTEGLIKIVDRRRVEQAPGDYRDEEGLLVCGVCGQRKELRQELKYYGTWTHARMCACDEKRLREEAEQDEAARERQVVKNLFKYSLVDSRFWESRFENFIRTEHNEKPLKIAKRYVDVFDTMLERNKGLLFYGEASTGKTYLASCIANALMDNRVPVLFTSILKLSESSYQNSEDKLRTLLDKMNEAKVLVLDDLGAERDTTYRMEQVFEVIDSRYGAKKPMIITTNYSLNRMQTEPDIRRRRVFERIFEVCHPVEVSGPSWRWKVAEDDYDDIEQLLLGE